VRSESDKKNEECNVSVRGYAHCMPIKDSISEQLSKVLVVIRSKLKYCIFNSIE